jgi:putative flippase GtrA
MIIAKNNLRITVIRWLKFNLVGGIGIIVQLAFLLVLKTVLHINYLIATALAVEATVIHNFFWHEKFTWSDRPAEQALVRFLRFNLTTGALSILGNLALMWPLAGTLHLNYLLANVITIATCSIANFLVSDLFVFRAEPAPALPLRDR